MLDAWVRHPWLSCSCGLSVSLRGRCQAKAEDADPWAVGVDCLGNALPTSMKDFPNIADTSAPPPVRGASLGV